MKQNHDFKRNVVDHVALILLIAPFFILACTFSACGQSGGDYELSWSTIDGGGGRGSGGEHCN